jgi:tetratricopeptide (TPR) repeat protein
MPGMGSLHHVIQTSNPECQRFFDQGLTLIYAFNFKEALSSFTRASELDSKAAMPLWGVALAHSPNYNAPQRAAPDEQAAFDAIQKAKQISVRSPSEERDLIAALARRSTNQPDFDPNQLANDYAAAMRDVSKKYPDDPDALTLYAESLMDLHPWHLWTSDGKPSKDTTEIESVLEQILQRWPDHVGANHFYTHLMEASPQPSKALESAKRLETLVPAAGHLLHMSAHIYFNCGDYQAAVRSTSAASIADRSYLDNPSPSDESYVMGYAQHNLRFLVAAASRDGEFQVAEDAAEQLATEARAAPTSWKSEESFTIAPLLVLIQFARWEDILALDTPQEGLPRYELFWHYARACAFASKNKLKSANEERLAVEEGLKEFPAEGSFGILFAKWSSIQEIISETLDARIATASGDEVGAIAHWRKAVSIQDGMPYQEPPVWSPLRESLGAALLCNRRAPEAEKVFRQDLIQHPMNPRSLFGLQMCLEAQGKTDEATKIRASFEKAWKGSRQDPLHVKDL